MRSRDLIGYGDRRDFSQEKDFAHGMRVALRFLDAIERHKRLTTFYTCGWLVERLPQLATEIVNRRHEPACHGRLRRPHADCTDRAEERHPQAARRMRRSRTGRAPVFTASSPMDRTPKRFKTFRRRIHDLGTFSKILLAPEVASGRRSA